jgi:hypothetical protein
MEQSEFEKPVLSNMDSAKITVDNLSAEQLASDRAILQNAISTGKSLPDIIDILRMTGNDVMAEIGERMLNEEKNKLSADAIVDISEDPVNFEEAEKNESQKLEDIEGVRKKLGISTSTETFEQEPVFSATEAREFYEKEMETYSTTSGISLEIVKNNIAHKVIVEALTAIEEGAPIPFYEDEVRRRIDLWNKDTSLRPKDSTLEEVYDLYKRMGSDADFLARVAYLSGQKR